MSTAGMFVAEKADVGQVCSVAVTLVKGLIRAYYLGVVVSSPAPFGP